MKFSLLLLAMVAVGAMGLAVPPPPVTPPQCPEFQILGDQLGSTPNMIQNVLHYNKNNVMAGSPVGPYFSIGSRCTWRLNGAFNCSLNMYADESRLIRIGSASLTSSQLSVTDQGALHLVGGYMNFVSQIDVLRLPNPGNPSAAENVNFLSQSKQVYFQPKALWPEQPPYLANLITGIPSANSTEQGFLTLWGSSGYDAASDSFLEALRGLGIDFRGRVICPPSNPPPPPPPPPVIEGCPCEDPRGVFSVNEGCIGLGAVRRTSPGTCVQLSFNEDAAALNC